ESDCSSTRYCAGKATSPRDEHRPEAGNGRRCARPRHSLVSVSRYCDGPRLRGVSRSRPLACGFRQWSGYANASAAIPVIGRLFREKNEAAAVAERKFGEPGRDVRIIAKDNRAGRELVPDHLVFCQFVIRAVIAVIDEDVDVAQLREQLQGIAVEDLAELGVFAFEEITGLRIDVGAALL